MSIGQLNMQLRSAGLAQADKAALEAKLYQARALRDELKVSIQAETTARQTHMPIAKSEHSRAMHGIAIHKATYDMGLISLGLPNVWNGSCPSFLLLWRSSTGFAMTTVQLSRSHSAKIHHLRSAAKLETYMNRQSRMLVR